MRTLRTIAKKPFEYATLLLARAQHFTFPSRFPWRGILRYLFDRYEIETTRFFKKRIQKGMTVVDVGASIGYFTRLFSRLVGPVGTVYAFEPDLENFLILKKNTAHLSNVSSFNIALSDKSGTTTFYHVPGNSSLHSLIPSKNATETHQVEEITLDAFVEKQRIHIDVIKIDVEGAEEKVFTGMKEILKNGPCVVFEYIPRSSKTLLDSLLVDNAIYSISIDGSLQPIEHAVFRSGVDMYTNLVMEPKTITNSSYQ